jgi:4-diphosphocytidyl-2-C-methyl-D-erythritol kinase
VNECVSIDIKKRIPFAAGLAGGSADGAAVIKGLNELFETDLTPQQMCEIGVKVGADVPFCIMGGTRICTGIGEKMEVIKPLKPCYIVLAKPCCSVSTANAYAEYDKHGYRRKPDQKGIVRAIKLGDLKRTAQLCENVFEQFIEVPDRAHIKTVMRNHGAIGSCMSGSGPTVYGIFTDESSAKCAIKELEEFCEQVNLTTPVWRACLTDSEI